MILYPPPCPCGTIVECPNASHILQAIVYRPSPISHCLLSPLHVPLIPYRAGQPGYPTLSDSTRPTRMTFLQTRGHWKLRAPTLKQKWRMYNDPSKKMIKQALPKSVFESPAGRSAKHGFSSLRLKWPHQGPHGPTTHKQARTTHKRRPKQARIKRL